MDARSKASSKSKNGNKYVISDELSLKGVSLFKLDVNYDHLKMFLEGVQNEIDVNTQDIEALKKLVGPYDILIMLQEQYSQLSESLQFSDKDIIQEQQGALQNYMTQIHGKSTKGALEKSIVDLRVKLFSIIQVVQHLYRDKKRTDERLNKLESELPLKYDMKECKEKMRKQKTQFETAIEELQRTSRGEVDAVEKRLNTDILRFSESVREVERKTLWKIQDCQDLLSKRINEEFVLEAVRSLEDKLLKEMSQLQSGENILKFSADLSYLRSVIKGLDDSMGEKQQKLKLQVADLAEQLKAKLSTIDKMGEQARLQGDKIADLNSRLASAINRLDVQHQIDQQRQKQKVLEDQMAALVEEQRLRTEALKDMNLNAENVAFLLSKIDPHKICQLEADVKKLEEQSIRNNVHWETLDAELRTRFDSFSFMQQLYSQQTQQKETPQKDWVTRDELSRVLQEQVNKGGLEEEKMRRLQKELTDMAHKVENAGEIERRVTRIFRDLDINGLVKQVKLKANDEEMRKELLQLENRIAQASETLLLLRKEIDARIKLNQLVNITLRKQPQGMMAASPPTDQIIGINTKKLYPINCLSCTSNPQARVKGNDGRYYQGATTKYDNFQEYAVEDFQQVQVQQQRPQSAVVNKSINANKRPISAKK